MSSRDRRGANVPEDTSCAPDYDERTFLYFLSVEKARARRSNRLLRLLTATFEQAPGKPAPLPPAVAQQVLGGLRALLRDTDVTGWYRQHRVAGAVLSDGADVSDPSDVVEERVRTGLKQRLPGDIARALRVRVIPLSRWTDSD